MLGIIIVELEEQKLVERNFEFARIFGSVVRKAFCCFQYG